jgi:hypothetical protein
MGNVDGKKEDYGIWSKFFLSATTPKTINFFKGEVGIWMKK